jgi:hypothetical protein
LFSTEVGKERERRKSARSDSLPSCAAQTYSPAVTKE